MSRNRALETPSFDAPQANRQGGSYAAPAAAMIVAIAYCLAFLVNAVGWLPAPIADAVRVPRELLLRVLRRVIEPDTPGSYEWINGSYLAIVGIVLPWVVMAMLGRGRPASIGVRWPNRVGLRVLVVAYVLSMPFLYWMVDGSGLPGYYLPHLRRSGALAFLAYYTVNMLGEHFLLHGVMLAALRPGMRWPDPPPPRTVFELRDERALYVSPLVHVLRWIGLPRACHFGVLGSALLFALVHVGKDPRELVLSLPGGIVLAYLAYRTNSFLTPFILHLATAGTALVMMLALE